MSREEYLKRTLTTDLALLGGLTAATAMSLWGIRDVAGSSAGWALLAVGTVAWLALGRSLHGAVGEPPYSLRLFSAFTRSLAWAGGFLGFAGTAMMVAAGPDAPSPSPGEAMAFAGLALLAYGTFCRRLGLHGRTDATAPEVLPW